MKVNTPHTDEEVSIGRDRITLCVGEMEPVIIPRHTLRTRLQLIEWVYRLTGWPGMNLKYMRTFIAAVFRYHGWALPDPGEQLGLSASLSSNELGALAGEPAGVL